MDENNVSLQEIENTLGVVSVIRDLTQQNIAHTTRDMEIVMAEMEEYKKRLGSL
jgi:GTPase involved in cell partitioning and DNA repair